MKLMVISTAPIGKKIRNRPGWYLVKVADVCKALAYAEMLAEQLDKLPGSWLVDTVKA
jgi:hypothetical protein